MEPKNRGTEQPKNRKTEKPESRVLVIVATYNERENILRLVPRIFEALSTALPTEQPAALLTEPPAAAPEALPAALIVDDNSPDGTGDAAEELKKQFPRLHVLHRAGKLGYGAALLAGIAWARENGFDAVVTMDADFSHDPAVLPQLISSGREWPVVIGARYIPGGRTVNWSLRRRLLSRGGNTFARLLLRMPVSDVTTGYRYLDLEALRPARIESVSAKGYGFLIETLFRIVSAGVRTTEVPITFADREVGKSKMSGNIIAEAFLLVLKLWWGKRFGGKKNGCRV